MHVEWDSLNTEGKLDDFLFWMFLPFLWGIKVKNDEFG